MKKQDLDLFRSCTYHRDETTQWVAENLAWRDGMPGRWPEARIRLVSYPMGFKPSWACCDQLYIMIMDNIPSSVEGWV